MGDYGRAIAHMNEDHVDALVDIVEHQTGIAATHPQIVEMDDDGFTCTTDEEGVTATIPFPGAPISADQVRDVMVAMTRDARA